MVQQLRPAIVLTILFTILTGLAFPLGLVGVAKVAVPFQAGGSLLERNGAVVGSALIGQNFTSDRYFQGRPSATTDTDPADSTKTVPAPYNAANSGGSNTGPTSKALVERVTPDVEKAGPAPVPGDAVTTSASGLDPHISPANALRQVPRVAKARGLDEAKLRDTVTKQTEGRLFGILGEPRVNVLALNMALDAVN